MHKKESVLMAATVLLLCFGLIWAGCGSGGGSAPPPTAITSVDESQNVASFSNQTAKFAAGTGLTFSNFGLIGGNVFLAVPQFKEFKSMELTGGTAITAKLTKKLAKSAAVASTAAGIKKSIGSKATVVISDGGSCLDGGTWGVSGSANDLTGVFNVTLTYANCQADDIKIHGTYTMSGTAAANSVSLSMSLTGFSITAYDPASNYGTPVSSMTANIAFTGSVRENTTSLFIAMTGNGTMTASEGGIDYSLSYTNYSIRNTYTPGTSFDMDAYTTNGRVSESWTIVSDTFGANISYENFMVGIKMYPSWDEEITISGVFTIDFTPDACFEGRFSIQTVTPIDWDDTLLQTTAGRLVVNSNTTIIFLSNGNVTVQYQGVDIPGLVDVPEVNLDGVCLIASL